VIVVSMQFGFKAGERKGQYWKTPNWIAQTLLKRLIVEIETAPDCDQSMLQVVSYSRHERRTEEKLSRLREAFWAFHVDRIYREILEE
jgi:hypothetical protein